MQDQQQLVLGDLQQKAASSPTSSSKHNLQNLPSIPDKRYFSIGEVSNLCLVKPHVLRYWEQEFPQLSPAKRRGSRRFYQRHEILLVRRIKSLLYGEGFTIEGARTKLNDDKKDNVKSSAASDSPGIIENTISQLKNIVEDLDRT